MSTTETKTTGFKNSIKNAGRKTKAFAKQQTARVKSAYKQYKSDIRSAYDIGYARGWDDAYDVPKRFGAKTAAAYGYKKGLRNRKRSDKYTKQYNRGGNKE